MIVLDCEQGSKEWVDERLGVVTASEFSNIITPARGDYSKSATTYMHKLIAELITGKETTGFMSRWMERGTELEDEARRYYEFVNEVTVKQVGFVYRDERKTIGCSPDGLLENKGKGLEIKCPSPGVMVGYLLNGVVPREYIPQVQGSMFVTGLGKWDFFAYCPGFNPLLITVERDKGYISKLQQYIHKFTTELQDKLSKLSNKNVSINY